MSHHTIFGSGNNMNDTILGSGNDMNDTIFGLPRVDPYFLARQGY
jgi:hypothetical protein